MAEFRKLAPSAYRGQVTDTTLASIEAIYQKGRDLERQLTNIDNDRTRSSNEKLPLKLKVAKEAKNAAEQAMAPVLKMAVERADKANADRAFHLYAGADNVMIAHLATTLMGKKPHEIAALAEADNRFARALNMFPASVYGLDQNKHAEYLDKAWRVQKPEQAEAFDSAVKDADALVKFGEIVGGYASTVVEQAENGMKAAGRVEV